MSSRLLSRFFTFCSNKSTSPAMRRPPFTSPAMRPPSTSPFTSRANPSPDGGSVKKKSPPERAIVTSLKNPDLGPFFLKLARDAFRSGDLGLLDHAMGFRSGDLGPLDDDLGDAKCVRVCAVDDDESNLELAQSLHSVASVYCNLGKFEEGLWVLERAVHVVQVSAGTKHALSVSTGYMQMGDVYNMMGRTDRRIECYKQGVKILMDSFGDNDPKIAQACSYWSEAHVEVKQFEEDESLCKKTLEIHRVRSPPSSEEAADCRLMVLSCEARGDYESALEHLVLASRAMIANGQENEVAAIDVSIGKIYSSLTRFDEALSSYQKALTFFKSSNGDNHPSVASVFVRLADLYCKMGKIRESRSYCENALRIYSKPVPGITSDEIARGMTEISAIYELFNEPEEALKILQKVMKLFEDKPDQQNTVARIESHIGWLFKSVRRYKESMHFYDSAITKLRAGCESKSALFGIVLNDMGMTCGEMGNIAEAVELFQEAREILERVCGPSHPDTVGANRNLALIYENLRSIDDPTKILEYVQKLGEDDDEKIRLTEILRDAGRCLALSTRKHNRLKTDPNSKGR